MKSIRLRSLFLISSALFATLAFCFRQWREPTAGARTIDRSSFADSVSTAAIELARGIEYRRVTTPEGQVAHIVSIASGTKARLRTFKARGRYDGLEDVRDIFYRARSSIADTPLVATNASFWRAGLNSLIGPTVADGEPIEMSAHRSWSSLLLYEDGSAAIERVRLSGRLLWRYRNLPIDAVNRRFEEPGIVLYNRYYGPTLPHDQALSDERIVADALWNRPRDASGDRTEDLDTAEALRLYRDGARRDRKERAGLKIVCRFLPDRSGRIRPAVNDTVRMIAERIDTGLVAIPQDGVVLSLGTTLELLVAIRVGDTLRFHWSVDAGPRRRLRDMVTGTPRLVRDGRAEPEHETEGSKAPRFVDDELARTAVGISHGGDTLFLVTIDSPNPDEGRRGMSLRQLAEFMRSIGARDAINLDGGGSTSMFVRGEMVSRQGWHPSIRNVGNALVAVRSAAD